MFFYLYLLTAKVYPNFVQIFLLFSLNMKKKTIKFLQQQIKQSTLMTFSFLCAFSISNTFFSSKFLAKLLSASKRFLLITVTY